MNITIKVYRPCIVVTVLFILLTENFMYLVNVEKLNVAGVLNYNDMWAYVLFLYEMYYILKIKMPKSYSFKFGIIGMIAGTVISSFQSSYIVGQPLMMGLRPQRFYIICLISYFLVRKQLAVKKMTAINLLDLIVTAGTFEGFFCTLQFFLADHVQFLHASTNIRYGSVRMYFDSGLIIFTTIVSWCLYLRKGGNKYLIALAFGMIYEFLISKGRLENVCVLCTLFVSFILLRKDAFKKVMVLLTLISVFVLILNTSYSKVLINTIKSTFSSDSASNEDTGDTGDTMTIRKDGRKHYSEQSNECATNFILGCGYPNTLYEKAMAYSQTEKYALVDNGIFAYKYIYGLFGVVIVGIMAIKAAIQSWMLYIKKGALFPISYLVLLVPLAYNIIFWWWKPDSTLLLCIYLAIVDHYYHDECDDEEFIL